VKKLGKVEFGDLVSYGVTGLFASIDKFEPWKKVKFETYCSIRVRGAMLDGVRNEDSVPRLSRRRAKAVDQAIETLRQKGISEPRDHEVRKLVSMDPETFQETKRVLAAYQDQRDAPPIPTYEDPRSKEPDVPLQFMEILRFARKRLTRIQLQVLILYYGEEHTFKEVGRILKLSEARICQLHWKAISLLRRKMKAHKPLLG
jgi:RNA polymerase sigma factor for flagellar operon FliA